MLVAHLADQRPEFLGRHDQPASPLNGFGQERRHRVGALVLDQPVKQHRTDLRQLGRILRERITIGVGRFRPEESRHQRLEGLAEGRRAIGGKPAEGHAVIGPVQRNELGAFGLARQLPILPRQLQRPFDGFRATRRKERLRHAFRPRHLHQQFRKLDRRRMRGAAEQRIILQLVQLRRDRLDDFLAPMPGIDVPQPALPVDIVLAVDVGDDRPPCPTR